MAGCHARQTGEAGFSAIARIEKYYAAGPGGEAATYARRRGGFGSPVDRDASWPKEPKAEEAEIARMARLVKSRNLKNG
jgi:hypothetical protein